MKNRIVIIGCGGHAKSILDVILFNDNNADIIFVDKNAGENETILGFPVLNDYNITDEKVIVGIGDNKKRRELSEKYYDNLTTIISKNAYIGHAVKIGKGVFIAHHVHVGILTIVDDFCIVNTSASVDHECHLCTCSFIGPNATLCGKVKVNENCFIGAGATIVPNITIKADSFIKANSLVKNIKGENH